MTGSWLEMAIIAMIALGIIVAIWRGGAANPESTGSLSRKLTKLQVDVTGVKAEVKAIDARVSEIDRRAATIDDIRGLARTLDEQGRCLADLDKSIDRVREDGASRNATLEATKQQVDRLYDFIVDRGMSK